MCKWREEMQHIFKKTFLAALLSLAIVPAAYATNGYSPAGLGQIHKAMGGAAVGNPQNTTTIMSNPAAASFVPNGYDVGAEIFKPSRKAKSNIFGTEFDGDAASAFFVPEGGYKKDVGKYSVGITVFGNGGMNTSYKPNAPVFPSPGGAGAPPAGTPIPFNATSSGLVGTTGIDLQQLFISPTISTKLNDKHSIGISLNLVAQQFKASGIAALSPNSIDPANFTDRGKSRSYGVGATIGWMGKLNDTFTMGASYRFKTNMGKFDEYKGLFANGGEFDVPAALTIGASAKVTPSTTVAVDIEKIYYSDVDAIANSGQIMLPLGSTGGPGFGWEDQTIFKIGFKTQATPKLAVMGGFNHGSSPVGSEDTFFGVLAPAVVEDHVTFGLEYALSKTSSVTGTYRHAFSNTVKGDLAFGQPLDITMEQDAIGIAFSKKF